MKTPDWTSRSSSGSSLSGPPRWRRTLPLRSSRRPRLRQRRSLAPRRPQRRRLPRHPRAGAAHRRRRAIRKRRATSQATMLSDGAVPPADALGNFVIGPTHAPSPDMTVQPGVPQGTVHNFTMESTDSKIYPGIARVPGSRSMVDPNDPAKRIVNSGPAPYTRRVAVYVPQQYVPGTIAPVIVGADGPDHDAVHDARQSDRTEARAGDDRRVDRQRQRRRAGQPARPRVRHDVGTVCGVRRDRSAAARREAVQGAHHERSGCARDDGLQLGRIGGDGDGVVSPRSLSSRAHVLGHVRESAVSLQSGDSGWRVGISPHARSRRAR